MVQVTRFRDRITGETVVERVFGEKALQRLYRTGAGRLTLDVLLCRPYASSVYGWLQRRSSSRRKIPGFISSLGIDAAEAELPIEAYSCLDDFFIRRLKPGMRPIDPDPEHFISPSDGRVLVYPSISEGSPVRVKGSELSVTTLLGDAQLARDYAGAAVAVLRLAPADYHRFHFPEDGIASPSEPVNGRLHSVHPIALSSGAPTFKNKRVITRLETRSWGLVTMVEIGALCVGTIVETYTPGPVRRGQEKGFFRFGGSSIVVLIPAGKLKFDSDLVAASADDIETYLKMGTRLGQRP
jgi:phosphatidylserine decarboxylase